MPSFSQFLLDVNEQRRRDLVLRNKWMIRLRWLYIILLAVIAIATAYLTNSDRKILLLYAVLSGLGLLANGLFWLAITIKPKAPGRYFQVIAALQISLDVLLASSVVFLQGGVLARTTVLYAIPVLIAGILFSKGAVYITAAASSLLYATTLLVHSFTISHSYEFMDLYVPLTFYPAVFMLLAAIMARFTALNANDERERTYRQLLAMLRHQLHHPSSVVAVIIEMLEHSDNYRHWPPKDKEYFQQLKRENIRLDTMITNILESVSEPTPAPLQHPEKVDMLQLINDVALSCALGAKRIDDLKANLPNESIEFDGEASQLKAAFDNIIENAFHYSESGTPVTVSLKHSRESGMITVEVTDKGKGMTEAEQKDLFKLFTRLEEQAGQAEEEAGQMYSMGLGLYVSKVIIERHHGTMRIKSKENAGTNVIIEFKEALWLRPEFYT